jgi:hypothetical protein
MDNARECYYAMRELVLRHPGGTSSEASAATLRKLCRIADEAVPDPQCRAALSRVEQYGAELFSGCGSGNWVRRRLLAELEELNARISALEALRRASKGAVANSYFLSEDRATRTQKAG